MNTLIKINQALSAVTSILDDVIPELSDVPEYSQNELRSARIILKDVKEQFLKEDHSNKLTDFLETYHEITRCIWEAIDSDTSNEIQTIYELEGTGAMYDLAKAFTSEFQKLHENTEWDGQYYDTIETFMNLKKQNSSLVELMTSN